MNASKKRGRPKKESPDTPFSSPHDDPTLVTPLPPPPPQRPKPLQWQAQRPSPPSQCLEDPALRHVIVVDSLADTCLECTVSKSSLLGYQYDLSLNLLRSGAVDRDTLAFILALVYFADWDDYDRESYLWESSSVIQMIRSPMRWRAWRTRLLTDQSYSFIRELFAGFTSKFFCFFLCVDVLDLNEEIPALIEVLRPAVEARQRQGKEQGQEIATSVTIPIPPPLMVPLTPPQTILLNLLKDVKNLTPNGLNSTFRRISCRVGSQYQADVSSCAPSAPLLSPPLLSDSELVYQPGGVLSPSELEGYLMAARKLIPIQSGYLIDTVKPTISTAALATSLVPPTPSEADTTAELEQKLGAYEQHIKHLARIQKLKPGVGLTQTVQIPHSLVQKFPMGHSRPAPSSPPGPHPPMPSSSSTAVSTATPLPSVTPAPVPMMVVKSRVDFTPFLVPATDCRQKYCWDDSLLELLHRSHYNPPSALSELQRLAAAASLAPRATSLAHPLSPFYNMRRWSQEALQIFFQTIR
jgi:hypothetical protein